MNDEKLVLRTESPLETEKLGEGLGAMLPTGTVVALRGELAAGKTCLVRGLARTLAPDAQPTSPTFTLVNEYRGARTLYHVDLYRLERLDEVYDLGYEDLFDGCDGVCAVEWAERAEALLPPTRLDVHLVHDGGDNRVVTIENAGVLAGQWQDALRKALDTCRQ